MADDGLTGDVTLPRQVVFQTDPPPQSVVVHLET